MKEEKKVFNCDRCGVECHYDKEYPYWLCYECNVAFEEDVVNRLKNKLKKKDEMLAN